MPLRNLALVDTSESCLYTVKRKVFRSSASRVSQAAFTKPVLIPHSIVRSSQLQCTQVTADCSCMQAQSQRLCPAHSQSQVPARHSLSRLTQRIESNSIDGLRAYLSTAIGQRSTFGSHAIAQAWIQLESFSRVCGQGATAALPLDTRSSIDIFKSWVVIELVASGRRRLAAPIAPVPTRKLRWRED